jgi:hypothetical protein
VVKAMSRSILQVEESIQNALESLRSARLTQQLSAVLQFLAPEGYHPVVELQEDGRKKRRTASADNWTPETGEILISFSKESRESDGERPPALESVSLPIRSRGVIAVQPMHSSQHSTPPSDTPEKELCNALEEVERQGRAFVALKWFRDEVLPSKGFPWTVNPEERQAVLARAVDSGMIMTSRVPNPRSPFPTTTIRLNRSRIASSGVERRYSPVRIQGEPLSTTILRDRGAR